jgi:hypothetical protein
MRRHDALADVQIAASCLVMLAASQPAADQFLSIGSTAATNLSEMMFRVTARTGAPDAEGRHDVLRI